jgi:phosphoglycolate phosphatase-like HAD superfamily hydrolase
MIDPGQALRDFQPEHDFFIGIDSDGCAFDTMEIKHKECFIPNTIRAWGLQPVARYAREAAEFVNLYSVWRGTNRWPALLRTLDVLRDRPQVRRRGAVVPAVPRLRAYVSSGAPLNNEALAACAAADPDPELAQGLAWSRAVNAAIAEMVHGIAPFVWAERALAMIARRADGVVVSQTPEEALVREWHEHGIDRQVRAIAGQEQGTKAEHLAAASAGRYAPGNRLMIGDAPGDREAAEATGCLFYPVVPGREEESWEAFCLEAFPRFLAGQYDGAYATALLIDFERALPDIPPWERQAGTCS